MQGLQQQRADAGDQRRQRSIDRPHGAARAKESGIRPVGEREGPGRGLAAPGSSGSPAWGAGVWSAGVAGVRGVGRAAIAHDLTLARVAAERLRIRWERLAKLTACVPRPLGVDNERNALQHLVA